STATQTTTGRTVGATTSTPTTRPSIPTSAPPSRGKSWSVSSSVESLDELWLSDPREPFRAGLRVGGGSDEAPAESTPRTRHSKGFPDMFASRGAGPRASSPALLIRIRLRCLGLVTGPSAYAAEDDAPDRTTSRADLRIDRVHVVDVESGRVV